MRWPWHCHGSGKTLRTVHWLFIVGMALFVSGIGFVIAAAQAARRAPARETAAIAVTPVASVRQIMKGIVGPAAATVFGSVGTTITAKGTEEKVPHTDAEWEEVGTSAAALIESGNLMLMGSRALDQGDWVKMSRSLIESSTIALRAAQTKRADQLFASGEAIYESCNNCHQKYQRGS
jgi:hypothetical protein